LLADDIAAAAIHSSKSQSLRTRTLGDFKRGRVRVLVATDVAARGLDITGLPQVVNYDLPEIPENYVHRIGRTGRAGETGVAISLVCDQEQASLVAIERLLGYKIPAKRLAEFQPKNDHDPDIIAAKRELKKKAAKNEIKGKKAKQELKDKTAKKQKKAAVKSKTSERPRTRETKKTGKTPGTTKPRAKR
jgi:ATP-dependent RNA helicase RhlE